MEYNTIISIVGNCWLISMQNYASERGTALRICGIFTPFAILFLTIITTFRDFVNKCFVYDQAKRPSADVLLKVLFLLDLCLLLNSC